MPLTYVELFAGCGGMSLGLDSVGMHRLLSNELSPMAAQTYAYNLLGTELESSGFAELDPRHRRVLWLQSKYPPRNTRMRLDENPQDFTGRPFLGELAQAGDLANKLLVADIRELNRYVDQHGPLLGDTTPDVVSGGPPCQSFSLAGLREYGNHRNRLPWEFANFVEHHRPKLVVLENVSGIMRPFKEDGQQVHVWFEVAKAFASKGYAPMCLHVNAARVGVAQNRPRFLMFAVRKDLVERAKNNLGDQRWALTMGEQLLDAQGAATFDQSHHKVMDLSRERVESSLARGPLADHFRTVQTPVTVGQAIGDLEQLPQSGTSSEYSRQLSELFTPALLTANPGAGPLANTELRRHSPKVRARFRAYQIVERLSSAGEKEQARDLFDLIKDHGDPIKAPQELLVAALGVEGLPLINEAGRAVTEPSEARALLKQLQTHKHTQRALGEGRPASAAVSIPDDASHYVEPRTLSVREMARIQSFPDEFVFRAQVTTGGAKRRYQVPQYTQVGNAVPPRLARQIGLFAQLLLSGS